MNGGLFTASNGNSLFLPAAGYRYYSNLDSAGSYCYYWSGSLSTYGPYDAWGFNFHYGNYGGVDAKTRNDGLPVRPVRVGLQN